MQFTVRKRRNPPTVIIVSLIDVLIVVLIFMIVTTTFKDQPSVKLALPEARSPKPGATENAVVVTIPKEGPIYLKMNPVTFDALPGKLAEALRENPKTTLAIKADEGAPFGEVVKVLEAAKAVNIPTAYAYTKPTK